MQEEWYKTETLESVLANVCIQHISAGLFQNLAATTIRILFYLATTTDFFGIEYKPCMSDKDIILAMSKSENVQFVGGLFIKLLTVAKYQSSNVNI